MKSYYAMCGVFRYYANKIPKRVRQLKFSCFTNKKFTPTLAYSLLPIDNYIVHQNLVDI